MMYNNNRFRNLCIAIAIIGLTLFLLLLTSCRTSFSDEGKLPEFTTTRPSRPALLTVDSDAQIPGAVVVNQILMQSYAEKLELYADAWENFYSEVTHADN